MCLACARGRSGSASSGTACRICRLEDQRRQPDSQRWLVEVGAIVVRQWQPVPLSSSLAGDHGLHGLVLIVQAAASQVEADHQSREKDQDEEMNSGRARNHRLEILLSIFILAVIAKMPDVRETPSISG